MSLMKRLLRSGKKAIIEEVVAGSSHMSVLPKNLIAPLPYRITKDGVRRTAVPSHGAAGRRAGEELCGGAKIWNGAKRYDTTAARVEPVRSVVRVRPSSIIVGLWPKPHVQVNNSSKKSIVAPPRFVSKKTWSN